MKTNTFRIVIGTLIIIAAAVASFFILRRLPPLGRVAVIGIDVFIFYLVNQLLFTKKKPKNHD